MAANVNWQVRKSSAKLLRAGVGSIKINTVNIEPRGERRMWVKRRRLGSALVAVLANLFFVFARAPVHLLIDLKRWRAWEITCFRLLYDRNFLVLSEGKRTVYVDEVPGQSLLEYSNRGKLTIREIEAAAKELRRAHGLWCQEMGDYWSHSDPNLDNFIYNDKTNRAQLIGFELIHRSSLSAIERHAEDIVVFLEDLMARVRAEQWLPFAVSFIIAYDQPAITYEARSRLMVSKGYATFSWRHQTDYLVETAGMVERIRSLEAALDSNLLFKLSWLRQSTTSKAMINRRKQS